MIHRLILPLMFAACAVVTACGGDGGGSDVDPEEARRLAALVPDPIAIADAGFRFPVAAGDTTGRGNRAKIKWSWNRALVSFTKGDYETSATQLEDARGFYEGAINADGNWPRRFRNLKAALTFQTGGPGALAGEMGEPEAPELHRTLDAHYQWLLAFDDLRLGRREAALARLAPIKEGQLDLRFRAMKLESSIRGEAPSEDPGEAGAE